MKKNAIILVFILAGFFIWPNYGLAQSEFGCCILTDIANNKTIQCLGGNITREDCPEKYDYDNWTAQRFVAGKMCLTLDECKDVIGPNCCIVINDDNKTYKCHIGMVKTECDKIEGGDHYEEYCDQIKQCTILAGDDPSELNKPAEPVYMKTMVTIPGSKFIAGESVEIGFNSMGEYIIAIYIFFAWVAGILSVTMIMYGGIKRVVSFGNPQKISDSNDTIVSAMVGLTITLGSYALLLFISPKLVEFDGVRPTTIKRMALAEGVEESAKGSTAVTWSGRNVSDYDKLLTDADFDRSWLKAIMLVESGGQPQAVSGAGACGLMQILPSTAQRLAPKGVTITCKTLMDQPGTSIKYAAQYLNELKLATCPFFATYKKSGKEATCFPHRTKCVNGLIYPYVIAGYNGGLGANCSSMSCDKLTWWECEKNPGYQETRNYVQKVWAAYDLIQTDPSFAWQE